MKKISVITINYNNVSGLKQTMDSVLGQTYNDIEYIVVDGGSNDGSKELIEQRGSALSYWVSEKDEGIYDAMNKGISKTTGEYLLFINSGDRIYEKTTIENVIPFLKGTEIVYGNLKIEENGQLKDGYMPDAITLSQMMNDTLWHPVSFIKRELFLKYGNYNTQYKICGDYDFFFKTIISEKVTTKHINQFIAVFDLKGMSSDAKNVPIIKAEKEMIQRSYLSAKEIEDFNASQKKSKSSFFKRWFQ